MATEEDEDVDKDRMVKGVVPPPRHPLDPKKLFDAEGKVQIKNLTEHLLKEGRLRKEDALKIITTCGKLWKREPNILALKDPITVCGDVHGQYFDLIRLIEAGGAPTETKYLFLGDYVDRGCFSTEVVFFMMAHKIVYTKTWYMLRGNHECRHLTSFFNFKEECMYKYDEEIYDAVMDAFDNLPIAATINKKFLCVHGGLSPDISSLKDIAEVDRFREVPREGAFCDLLWADPVDTDKDKDDGNDSDDEPTTWFAYNDARQCSYVFGIDAVKTFLTKNKLTAIIRAHEAQLEGYKMHMVNETSGIPRVITIFSAPNYCDVYKNKGAVLKFDNELLNIRQFVCSPHPYYLPNFMDVFTWSLPFVAEKVTDMLVNILAVDPDEAPLAGHSGTSGADTVAVPSNVAVGKADEKKTILQKRGGVLREKVLAATKLMRMFKTMREERENLLKLKQLTPSGKVPFGLIRAGPAAITKAVKDFQGARNADKPNERMPGSAPTPRDSRARNRGFSSVGVTKSGTKKKKKRDKAAAD